MTRDELETAVWELVDDNCAEMSQGDYLKFLKEVIDNAESRVECVEMEIEDDERGEE